jgi:hypothetical protein
MTLHGLPAKRALVKLLRVVRVIGKAGQIYRTGCLPKERCRLTALPAIQWI